MPKISEEQRVARREQILGAATRCVAREGFHKTTMAHVIEESGLSAGAVYGYFRSKEDLIRAIAERSIGRVAVRLHELAEGAEPVDAVGVLEVFLRQATALSQDPAYPGPAVLKVGIQAWAEAVRDPHVHAIASEKMGSVRSALEDVVRRAQRDGTIARDADPVAVAQVLFGLLPGFVVESAILGDVTPTSYLDGLRGLLSAAPAGVADPADPTDPPC